MGYEDPHPHRPPHEEVESVLHQQRTSQVILAILLNLAMILCNLATFWLVTTSLPLLAQQPVQVINNLSSIVGIGIALASLHTGWSYLQNPSNRLSFSLFCAMNLVVALGTFS